MLGMLLEGIDFFHVELPFIFKKSIPALLKDHIHYYRVILQNSKFRDVLEFSDICYYNLSILSFPLKHPFSNNAFLISACPFSFPVPLLAPNIDAWYSKHQEDTMGR